jgi:hypothetical protein
VRQALAAAQGDLAIEVLIEPRAARDADAFDVYCIVRAVRDDDGILAGCLEGGIEIVEARGKPDDAAC